MNVVEKRTVWNFLVDWLVHLLVTLLVVPTFAFWGAIMRGCDGLVDYVKDFIAYRPRWHRGD